MAPEGEKRILLRDAAAHITKHIVGLPAKDLREKLVKLKEVDRPLYFAVREQIEEIRRHAN